MPTSVVIKIVLHGLIVLAPSPRAVPSAEAVAPNHMTALLVSAGELPPEAKLQLHDAMCFVKHVPQIRFPAVETRPCGEPDCQLDHDFCVCTLEHKEVSIEPDVEPQPLKEPEKLARSLPFDSTTAGNFSYVASLKGLGYTIDPAFLSSDPLPAALAPKLAARFKFPVESLVACDLATRRRYLADYIHPLTLRPLHSEEQASEVGQAMAQQLVATARVTVDPSAGQSLKLVLSPLPGEQGAPREFPLPTNLNTVLIRLSNSRPMSTTEPDMPIDDPCDDGIGRDFAFLYDFVQNPPSWAARSVPHVDYSLSRPLADAEPAECQILKDPMSRPICPMGTTYP